MKRGILKAAWDFSYSRKNYGQVTFGTRKKINTGSHLTMSRDIFGYHNPGACYWHLVGGGQEYCETSHRQFLQQKLFGPKFQ